MASNKQRAWYIDRLLRIGLVEKATNAVTKDGYTSDWQSISEVKDLRMYTISRDADLAINSMTSTWAQIPDQFHEVIVSKAIATGYKDPRHMDFDIAQYFDNEYEKGVKRVKKFARNNYQTTGVVKPFDY